MEMVDYGDDMLYEVGIGVGLLLLLTMMLSRFLEMIFRMVCLYFDVLCSK